MRAIDEQSQPPDRSLEYAAVGDRCGPRQGFGGTNNLVICGRSKPVVGADGPDNRATVGAVAGQAGYRVGAEWGMTTEKAKPNLWIRRQKHGDAGLAERNIHNLVIM